jgi:hypothetical protein
MDEIIARFPPWFVALVVLTLALAGFFFYNPPKTTCDVQIETFAQAQKDFLYPMSKGAITLPPDIKSKIDMCLKGNSPGSCVELFSKVKRLLIDLDVVSNDCRDQAAEDQTLSWLWRLMTVIVQIAWGEKPPPNSFMRQGWLDASDISVFCKLQHRVRRLYTPDRFEQWRVGTLPQLPGADKLQPNDLFERSLLSTPCDQYR